MVINRDPEGKEIAFLKEYVCFDGAKVLEIGCGDGYLTKRYADSAQLTIGIDPNLDALNTAKKIQSAQFANSQAGDLPFADETFDVAIFSSSL